MFWLTWAMYILKVGPARGTNWVVSAPMKNAQFCIWLMDLHTLWLLISVEKYMHGDGMITDSVRKNLNLQKSK